jgi:hypothetical protein
MLSAPGRPVNVTPLSGKPRRETAAAVENFGALWNIAHVWESKPDMKTLSFLLTLVMCCHWCFAGRPDAAVVVVGEWSEPVGDGDGHTLRGRLVVCDDRPANASNHARVYLELEHGGSALPMEVYHDIESTALNLELRDGHDQLAPRKLVAVRRPSLPPCWVTLPCDSTVRLRSDLYAVSLTPKPDGLLLMLGSGTWVIPTNAAGEFYLSGTFTPPADHPSALKYHIWQGTLKLPKVKIPPPKAVKAG